MRDAGSVTTVQELLGCFTPEALAADTGVAFGTVQSWFRFGRVPEQHWDAFCAAAKKRGVRGVNRRLLTRLPDARGARSFEDIVRLFPTVSVLAHDLGCAKTTVQSWLTRDSIPLGWWDGLVKSAKSYGIRHLTLTLLRNLAIARAHRRQPNRSGQRTLRPSVSQTQLANHSSQKTTECQM